MVVSGPGGNPESSSVHKFIAKVNCRLESGCNYFLMPFFKGMIENFKYLIDLYGHIPNGNR